jgi:hypothetical protein
MKTTLIAVMFILIFGGNAIKAQNSSWEKELGEKSSSTYARLKYYWPDSMLQANLPHLPGTLNEKRCFVFGLANFNGGRIRTVHENALDKYNTYGILEITQIRVDDFYQHHPEEKIIFEAKDLADPSKGDYITRVMPLRILDDAVAHYGLISYDDIAKQWKIGGTRWQTKNTDYDLKVAYSTQKMHDLQGPKCLGAASIFNKPPDE